MKIKVLYFLIAIVFYFVFTNSALYNAVNNEIKIEANEDLSAKLDSICAVYIDSGFTGVVLIADSKKIILNNAYGRTPGKLNANTPFWIASNTKPITAIAILKLSEEGKVSVGDPISKYIKEVPPDKKNITIEQLLTHTSGLPSDFVCEGEQNRELAVKKILSQELTTLPGEKFNYSNDGYILLAAIIELSSNEKYESFIRENIFENSNMKNSGFWGDDIYIDPVNDSARYKPFYSKIFRDDKPLSNWNNRGASGVYSTAKDLYKMINALKSGSILSPESLKKLFEPRVEINITNDTILSYGYGWAIIHTKNGVIETRHRGRSDWMHNNCIYILPNGYVVIAWSRDSGPDNTPWSSEICSNIIKEIYLYENPNY